MAPAKFERIISVSSEDPSNPAENLLNNIGKKWKCKNAGEKQISVVIQLRKAEFITAVDVGNCGSAIVEILVSKTSNPDDFKVLVVASSLMTLHEAKLGTNLNNVRFFKGDSLSRDVALEKWDRIKVVCTQPYNRLIQYGLAFLVVHTTDSLTTKKDESPRPFQLKDTSTDTILAGSLFAKVKKTSAELKGAAAIREASVTGLIDRTIPLKVGPRPEESANSKEQTPGLRKNTRDDQKDRSASISKAKPRNVPNGGASSPAVNGNPNKRSKPESRSSVNRNNPPKRRLEKPFNKLFDGVIFTISGFQNPFRSELRKKALEMGAKYRPDWDNTCTHLLCAFPNTPKFNQVLGHGKIITKEWIETCYNRRTRIPWRRHALHPPDKALPESEEEVFEYTERPPSPVDNRRRVSPGRGSSPDTEEEVERVLERQAKAAEGKVNEREDETSLSVNEDSIEATVKANEVTKDNTPAKTERMKIKNSSPKNTKACTPNKNKNTASLSSMNNKDTSAIKNKKSPSPKKKPSLFESVKPEHTFDMDTDEEDESSDSKKFDLPVLSAFFEGVTFHVCNDLPEEEYQEICRYIFAHKGLIIEEEDLQTKDINYLIAVNEDTVKKVKGIQSEVIAVRPEWIWKAHDEARIPPTSSFQFN